MNIIYIIVLIQFIAIFYLINKTKKLEKFDLNSDINNYITSKYKSDITSIRAIADVIYNIDNNNQPCTVDKIECTQLKVLGDLTVNDKVSFTNKNTMFLNIFPKLMVIAWGTGNIPKGWALCDGNKYILDNNGIAIINNNGIETPNLQSRFVVSASINKTDRRSPVLNIGEIGGEEKHTLSIDELPQHTHTNTNAEFLKISAVSEYTITYNRPIIQDPHYTLDNNTEFGSYGGKTDGTTEPHENMPPYYILTYIMKL